jgi:hypothetical protein
LKGVVIGIVLVDLLASLYAGEGDSEPQGAGQAA